MKKLATSAIIGGLCLLADPVAAGAQITAGAPSGEAPAFDQTELLVVAVTINGLAQEGEYLVARRRDRFLIRVADLTSWHIRIPAMAPASIDEEDYLPLEALAGATAEFDAPQQRLLLTIPAELFEARHIAASSPRARPTEGAFAAFLNYDLSVEYHRKLTGNALLEAGLSDEWGLVASTVAGGNATGGKGLTRLESYYLHDDPKRLTRLVVGDTVTAASDWTHEVRFGGVRWGTEFALQPDLITFPTASFAGRAAVPSTVELLVNDALRFQSEIGQGPFSIDQVPLVTGAGDVTVITRDALGTERRVTTSYYASSRLLRRGLDAWSLEAGVERRDYGIRSFAYRNPFIAASFRRGITDWLTLDSRMEVSGNVRMGGGGASVVWAPVGEFSLAGAVSHGREGSGFLYRLSASRITPVWSVAVSYQHASRHFDQLGIDDDQDRITDQFQASTGLSLGRYGDLGLAYTDLRYADGARTRLASVNYSVGVGQGGFLSLFALRSQVEGLGTQTTVGAGLTIALGNRSSAYVQADSRNVLGEVRLRPPTDRGWGYRIAASHGETDRQQAEVEWRGDVGEFTMEAARLREDLGLRALASGGGAPRRRRPPCNAAA